MIDSPNFGFLDASLADYAIRAERYVFDDANTSLIKSRQFAELIARHAAAHHGLETTDDDFKHTIRMLQERRLIPRNIRELLDYLRLRGNEAAHGGGSGRQEAWASLIDAHQVAIWYHKTFTDESFLAEPFRRPPIPKNVESSLREELESIREDAARYQQDLAASRGENKELEDIRRELETESQRYHHTLSTYVERDIEYERQLTALRKRAKARTPAELDSFIERSHAAAREIGFRGEQAQHVPLAQIRIVSPRKSKCHKASKLLAQSSDGGFVRGYCAQCGEGYNINEYEFSFTVPIRVAAFKWFWYLDF